MPPRPQVAIADPSLTVEPGRRASTRVRIRNTGRQVAHYQLSVVDGCEPARWATIATPQVKLNPGADTDVLVHFEPPHDTQTRAGTFPYGIRVEPGRDDGQLPMVGEADLTVGAITAIEVRLTPRRSAGRFNGKHRVLLDNQGTEDLQVRLRAYDDDERLSAAVVPQTVNVPAGGSGEALLRVRARTPLLAGKRQSHPFHVAYRRRAGSSRSPGGPTDGGEVEATVDGSYDQKPVVAKWMVVAATLALGLVGYLGWRAVQPPEPEPGPPPLAPAAFAPSQLTGGMVQLSWVTDANVEQVRLRRVDCDTARDPLPVVIDGELGEVDVADARSGRHQVGPFEVGVPLCFQARSVTADGSVSVWSPEPPEVTLGDESIPAPEGLAVAVGADGTAEVSWEPVDAPGNVRYDLLVDGRSVDPNGFTTTSQRLPGLEPGEHAVQVQAVLETGRSRPSDPQPLIVPERGEGGGGSSQQSPGGGSGGGTGTGGGGEPSERPPVPQGHFVVIPPAGGAADPQFLFALDVVRNGDPQIDGDESFPDAELAVVDDTISLPGLGLEPGTTVIVDDGFDGVDEIVDRCEVYLELVERIYREDRARPESGLSLTCRAFRPLTG